MRYHITHRLAASLAALLLASPLGLTAPSAAAPPQHRRISLPTELSGDAAIRALGDDLALVAAEHGKSIAQVKKALREDRRLFVDRNGKLFYKEAALDRALASAASEEPAPWLTLSGYSLADAFSLHSKPGAQKTIYLDFDGHVLSKTAWNYYNGGADIVAPPWDLDGDPSSFNDTERSRILQIWQRVAEDYAPFDVDVTTQAPDESALTRSSLTDEIYGMRVLISPISSYFGAMGGVAYVGTFDSVGDYYKTALVFPERLSNAAKFIGEAASHECGHTGGLMHDGVAGGAEYYAGHGSGETGWAPIMGNSYSRNVTQWSKGEYPNASNTEDDFAVLAANGLVRSADDHPDAGEGAILIAGAELAAHGIIGSAEDIDVVSIASGDGTLTVSVVPASSVANLDVSLELRDSAGTLVATANPASQLAASLTVPVREGIYHLAVSGVGYGDPATGYSDYASVGAWKLTGTAPTAPLSLPPVPRIVTSAIEGTAPLTITFDGTGSTDLNGPIASWRWDFGDGATAFEPVASHTFTAPGTYQVTLTVTNALGISASATTTIRVAAENAAPTAAIAFLGQTIAPATITFDASTSRDPDGSIVGWTWDFGDGTSGFGRTVSHTYEKPGTYTVTLVVTDDRGASASGTALIEISAASPPMRVSEVRLVGVISKAGTYATATIRVVDESGAPVQGAEVACAWNGVVTGTSSGITGTDGAVTLKSKTVKKSGTVSVAITSVTKAGYVFDQAGSVTTASTSIVRTSTR